MIAFLDCSNLSFVWAWILSTVARSGIDSPTFPAISLHHSCTVSLCYSSCMYCMSCTRKLNNLTKTFRELYTRTTVLAKTLSGQHYKPYFFVSLSLFGCKNTQLAHVVCVLSVMRGFRKSTNTKSSNRWCLHPIQNRSSLHTEHMFQYFSSGAVHMITDVLSIPTVLLELFNLKCNRFKLHTLSF